MSANPLPTGPVTPGVAKNIDAVMQIENEFLEGRSGGDRVGDAISRVVGSLVFVIVHILAIAGWILVNIRQIPAIVPFDAYPFPLLALTVSMEAVFLTTFVLMSQNRQNKQADHRSHLHLQIGLLAEQETTKIIQMLHQICKHLGIENAVHDKEVKEMAGRTAVDALAHELTDNLRKAQNHQPTSPRRD